MKKLLLVFLTGIICSCVDNTSSVDDGSTIVPGRDLIISEWSGLPVVDGNGNTYTKSLWFGPKFSDNAKRAMVIHYSVVCNGIAIDNDRRNVVCASDFLKYPGPEDLGMWSSELNFQNATDIECEMNILGITPATRDQCGSLEDEKIGYDIVPWYGSYIVRVKL